MGSAVAGYKAWLIRGGPKRAWLALGALLVLVGVLQVTPGAQANTASVVFVTGNASRVPAGDQGPIAELEDLGFDVVLVDDDAVQESDATTASLVVVSTTVSPAKVGDTFRDAAVPVITWERFMYGNLGMTAAGSGRGEVSSQRDLSVVALDHPLAAGLAGRVRVQNSSTNFSYGVPSSDATVVATTVANSSRATIFAYDAGDTMVGHVAPARRVGFYLSYSSARTWNEQGVALFRAAVTWAADQAAAINRPPTVDAGPDREIVLGDTITLEGSAADDGLPDPPAIVATTWTGPSEVDFDNPSDAGTEATFPVAGIFTLTLTGQDGELEASDTVVISVRDPSLVKRALFISSRAVPPSVERPAAERLETLGFDVVYGDDNQVGPADVSAADLVLIGSSVSPGALDPQIADLAVPMMIWERRLFDDFGFTAPNGPSGEISGRTVRIVGDGEPPVDDLSGNVTVYTRNDRLSWTRPEGDAIVLARASNSASRVTMFAYDQGAAMADSVAPDRRLGFFSALRGPSVMSEDGWRLFDASVDWLIADGPTNQAPVVAVGENQTIDEGDTLDVEANVSDDGLPEPPSTVVLAWSGPTGVAFDPADSAATSISFPAPGTYLLRLTADDGEATSFDELEVTVEPNPLTAVIASDVSSGVAPLTVTFDGTGSSDGDGGIVGYAWDFGDGSTATGATPSREFPVGNYTVTLTVTDTDGFTDSTTATISAVADRPNAVPTADATELSAPGTVIFDGSGSSDVLGIASYAWDFGDGTTGAGATPAHTYDRTGVFEVRLEVTAPDGRTDTARLLIRIGDPADTRIVDGLILLYDFDQSSGSAVQDRSGFGAPLNLDASDPTAIEWLPGGGLRLTGPTAIVSDEPATKIRQAVEASDALTVEAWVDPAIVSPPEPGRLLSIAPDDSIRNLSVSQGFVGNGGSRIEARLVSEEANEQGYPAAETANGTLDGELVHVVFTRNADGAQRIWLDGVLTDEADVGGELADWDPSYPLSIGADADGLRPWLGDFHLLAMYDRALTPDEVCWNLAAGPGRSVTSGNAAPSACFTVDTKRGVGPLTVEMDGRGSGDPDGTIVSYAWDFGDGVTATGPVVSHTYGDGDHVATLTVSDDSGVTATSSITIIVRTKPEFPARTAAFEDALGLRASGGLFDPAAFLLAEDWVGSPIVWTSQFLERRTAGALTATARSLMAPGSGLRELSDRVELSLAVPIGLGTANARTEAGREQIAANLQAVAAGTYDDNYLATANALVEGGHSDAVLRLGHEFSGRWAPWSSQGNEANFIAAWRHVHDLFESVSPDFQFDWNSARGTWVEYGPPAYPGDDYVDIISIDIYWRIEPGEDSWSQSRWRNQFEAIMESHRDFAVAHGKPVAYPEWGLIGGDEPRFIEQMYIWMANLPADGPGSLAFQAYFNSGSTREELADHPASKQAFIELFGNPG